MTKAGALDQKWLAWLADDECLPWLRVQAMILLRQAGGLGLPENIWPYKWTESLAAGERDVVLEEVAHDLWIFIRAYLEAHAWEAPPELAQGRGRSNLLGAYFRNGYLFNLRSRARRKEASLYHYLYRRVRELVSQHQAMHHLAGPRGTLFSLERVGEPVHTLRGLVDTDYSCWPSPAVIVEEKQFLQFRTEDLLELAGFFWREATSRIKRPCYLPCRELVAYLAAHYQCLRTNSLATPAPEAPAEECWSGQIQIESLQVLAAQCLARWSPVRRKVFALALDPGNLTLRAVAERAGLGGPSQVQYHLKRACEDLASFCESWPGVPPSASDRSFWTEFIFCVAAACKNAPPDR